MSREAAGTGLVARERESTRSSLGSALPGFALKGRGNLTETVAFSISDKVMDDGDLTENLIRLRDNGFAYIHFSQGWRDLEPLSREATDLWLEALAASGVRVLDVHGCHPKDMNIWDEHPERRQAAMDLFVHRLRLTKELGGDAMVYHVPYHCEPAPEIIERFIDALARLEDTAREIGVRVALENHYLHENDRIALAAAFERFESDYVGLTFDSGHAVRSGNTDWLIDNCFDRLAILHLHDNEPEKDRHWLPWHERGHVPWERIAEAIARSSYTKPLQFEVQWKEKEQPDQLQFLKDAHSAALRLHSLVEAERAANKANCTP